MDAIVDCFHTQCLKDCNSFSCPVCYLKINTKSFKRFVCMECGTSDALWFCLTCAHVGCGHQIKRHATEHYTDTKHRYTVDLQGFKVWDFQKSEWLHNCLNDDDDQKLHLFSRNIAMKFVNTCLCAVCKYRRTARLLEQFTCMKCIMSTPQHLWICVDCSHVGCGRYKNGHALQHFRTTNHPLVMQLQNLSIWDYNKQNYQYMKLHETEAIESVDVEINKENFKTEIDDGLQEGFLHENDSSASIEDFTSAAELATARKFCKVEHSTAAELLQQQHEDLLNRMVRLERQWQEFGQLTEVNRKMITIEKRLLDLTSEKQILENKLGEHDTKLSELLLQISENASPQKIFETGEIHDSEPQGPNSVFQGNFASSRISSKDSTSFNLNEFITIFIVGIVAFLIFRFAFHKVFEIFKNLF